MGRCTYTQIHTYQHNNQSVQKNLKNDEITKIIIIISKTIKSNDDDDNNNPDDDSDDDTNNKYWTSFSSQLIPITSS